MDGPKNFIKKPTSINYQPSTLHLKHPCCAAGSTLRRHHRQIFIGQRLRLHPMYWAETEIPRPGTSVRKGEGQTHKKMVTYIELRRYIYWNMLVRIIYILYYTYIHNIWRWNCQIDWRHGEISERFEVRWDEFRSYFITQWNQGEFSKLDYYISIHILCCNIWPAKVAPFQNKKTGRVIPNLKLKFLRFSHTIPEVQPAISGGLVWNFLGSLRIFLCIRSSWETSKRARTWASECLWRRRLILMWHQCPVI